jgi:hypothetical protein
MIQRIELRIPHAKAQRMHFGRIIVGQNNETGIILPDNHSAFALLFAIA